MKPKTFIYPTHTCFDDALDLVDLWLKTEGYSPRIARVSIVHAICLIPDGPNQPDAGAKWAHAWVEVDNFAWEAGIFQGHKIYWTEELDIFRTKLRIKKELRYTVKEALALNYKANHYGPWDDEIAALCVKSGEDHQTFRRL